MTMLFNETKLKGSFLVEPECLEDDRGFFARAWCKKEFEANGLSTHLVQCNISFNRKRGTLRGMHYQKPPYAETKLVRCTNGAIFDVIIDLRPESPTFLEWIGVELTANSHKMLYVPEEFAHGYQTLTENTEIFYQVSQYYSQGSEGGIRWDDPIFGIEWPEIENPTVSEKDKSWSDYVPQR